MDHEIRTIESGEKSFHEKLMQKTDIYVHDVYRLTRSFPKEELYGVTSQLRRAALSIPLNYIEGYSRQREKVYINFLEISYGSLQESKYLLKFAHQEDYLEKEHYEAISAQAEEIGKMLWSTIKGIKNL